MRSLLDKRNISGIIRGHKNAAISNLHMAKLFFLYLDQNNLRLYYPKKLLLRASMRVFLSFSYYIISPSLYYYLNRNMKLPCFAGFSSSYTCPRLCWSCYSKPLMFLCYKSETVIEAVFICFLSLAFRRISSLIIGVQMKSWRG